MTAFEAPGAMDKIVALPFGQMPAGVALNIAIFDVATHAVDLAARDRPTRLRHRAARGRARDGAPDGGPGAARTRRVR